jgi:hypothetical protein
VASNRKSKKKDGCEKAGKLSSKRGRENVRVVSIFFHLFAFDADVCVVPLCICVCARIKQTNRRVSSTSLYICMYVSRLLAHFSLPSFFSFLNVHIYS